MSEPIIADICLTIMAVVGALVYAWKHWLDHK